MCPTHGAFKQTPTEHINKKRGCVLCTRNYYDGPSFIEAVSKVHNDFYDYSLTVYEAPSTKVNIICPIHGIFSILPYNHYKGSGCISCGIIKTANSKKYSSKTFIEKATIVHKNSYDYSLTNYVSSSEKVIITCKDHGPYEQLPANHLRGAGCIKCFYKSQQSRIERDFITLITDDLNELVESNIRPSWLNGKELDIYIPRLNLAIEINGLVYHHSSMNVSLFYDRTYKEPNYHLDKFNICRENNVNLIHIFDFEDLDEWKEIILKLKPNNFSVSFDNIIRYVGNLKIYGKSGVLIN